MNEKYVINLGRQLGSGGKEIGEKIAKQLNIAFYDKELINLASKESGVSEEFFEKADEKSQTILGGLFTGHFPIMSECSYTCNSYLSNDTLFKIQSDVIRKLSEEQSCLFVGRCADYILRDNPRCVNIFVSAPLKERIRRIQDLHQVTADEAEDIVEKADKKRSSYYNYYSCKTWGTASTYHLCIDSSVLGIDGTVDFILQFIRKKLNL